MCGLLIGQEIQEGWLQNWAHGYNERLPGGWEGLWSPNIMLKRRCIQFWNKQHWKPPFKTYLFSKSCQPPEHAQNYIALVTPSFWNINSIYPGFKNDQQVKQGWRKRNSGLIQWKNSTCNRKWKDVGKLPNTETHKCFNINFNRSEY